MKDLIARYTSRKFLAAVATSITAYIAAAQDQIFTQPEILLIISPVIAFIAVEGAADVTTRFTNIPDVKDAQETDSTRSTSSSKAKKS
jgi:hypothetical protein